MEKACGPYFRRQHVWPPSFTAAPHPPQVLPFLAFLVFFSKLKPPKTVIKSFYPQISSDGSIFANKVAFEEISSRRVDLGGH